MLKILRKKGVMKKLLWALAILIILSFGLLGQAYLLDDRPSNVNYAGIIFDKKVSLKEFRRNYTQTEIQAIIQYGENYKQIRQFLNLEKETWDRLILLHESKQRKIKITDKKIVEAIKDYPFFQRNDKFDNSLYKDILRYVFKTTSRDFEEGVRDSLKFVKLYEQETTNVTIPDQEVFDAYKNENEKLQISYILFAPEKYIETVPADEIAVKDYYVTHKEEFLLPPMINVEYIRIDYPEETAEADAETAETEEKKSGEENDTDATALPEEDIPEAVKEATIEKALTIEEELIDNPDFSLTAKEHNLATGTSGFFSLDQPNLQLGWSFPVIQKVFQLETGEISDPLETINGYQILRVIEKKESYIPEFEEAKDKAEKAWTHNEAMKLAKQKAEESLEKVKETYNNLKRPDFAQISKDNSLELFQTPVFSRGQYLPKIGISKDFQDASFALKEDNKISDVVEITTGYCILHLDSIVPIDEDDYAKKKEELKKRLLTGKKETAFLDFITNLRLKANLEDNISKLRKQQEKEQQEREEAAE